ncbi:MAG: hypothetical protein K0Q59_568 [Paenibacillus sp.]|jgi:hypothetical protein|nr:hypothetical protein [Paenibacillus sp.]
MAHDETGSTGQEAERDAEEQYERRFLIVSGRMEKLLRRLIGTGLALLVIAQLLLAIPQVRKTVVKVERLEGIPYERMSP